MLEIKRISISIAVALAVFMLIGIAFAIENAETVYAEEGDIDGGVYDGVPWRITSEYELLIGEDGKTYEYENKDKRTSTDYPWNEYSGSIKSAGFLGAVKGSGSASHMFSSCFSLASLNLSGFDTSNVTDMSAMFSGCNILTALDLSGFDTSNVTDMGGMFASCTKLSSLDLSGIDTGNVTNMGGMFSSCRSLLTLDVSNFDMSKVIERAEMFSGCEALISLKIGKWRTFSTHYTQTRFPRSMRDVTTGEIYEKDTQIPNVDNHTFEYAPGVHGPNDQMWSATLNSGEEYEVTFIPKQDGIYLYEFDYPLGGITSGTWGMYHEGDNITPSYFEAHKGEEYQFTAKLITVDDKPIDVQLLVKEHPYWKERITPGEIETITSRDVDEYRCFTAEKDGYYALITKSHYPPKYSGYGLNVYPERGIVGWGKDSYSIHYAKMRKGELSRIVFEFYRTGCEKVEFVVMPTEQYSTSEEINPELDPLINSFSFVYDPPKNGDYYLGTKKLDYPNSYNEGPFLFRTIRDDELGDLWYMPRFKGEDVKHFFSAKEAQPVIICGILDSADQVKMSVEEETQEINDQRYNLKYATVEDEDAVRIYTGKPIEPDFTCFLGGSSVPETYIDVQYENNIDIGTATVILTGKTPYYGQKKYHFRIVPESEEDNECNHEWNESFTIDKPATCAEEGSKSIHCSICDAVKDGSEIVIQKTDHTFGGWNTTKEAACTEDGIHEKACTVCGNKVTEPIPAKGHSFGAWETITDSTCVAPGLQQRTCQTCGAVESKDLDPSGHTWDEGVITTEPTYMEEGVKTFTCTVCNETRTEDVPILEPEVGSIIQIDGATYIVISRSTVALAKAGNTKKVTIPEAVIIGGNTYKVTTIKANTFKGTRATSVTAGKNIIKIEEKAFRGSKVKTLTIKSKKLKKNSVKGSLKNSKVITVKVKVGNKMINKKYVKKYRRIFTKKNAGKKVTVK